MIALLRFLFDIVLAFVAPRATLVAENLISSPAAHRRQPPGQTASVAPI
ncbi:MAG TPA: hypothetical protein VFG23_21705 [Polyangia bacterium]|nr:hypothetical protein [Polyangia bacterium]